MDRLVRLLFSWEKLRNALFAEVDFYNSITRTLEDPEAMKTGAAMWCDSDGWRGWTIKDNGTYYFHDIPEKSIGDIFDVIYMQEERTQELMDRLGSDYDENGVPYWEKWEDTNQ